MKRTRWESFKTWMDDCFLLDPPNYRFHRRMVVGAFMVTFWYLVIPVVFYEFGKETA